ncbi:putative kinesin [Leptomonas pyrrhocoris]|uniref:Putative kinesin n=1 Tax=Leptomonas pyrrhocoris TaxID=157538 RepID=A0A0N0VEK8_LEPPY|nr:putative kinesin [Leptomonas pyrrhocoris]KPA78644.1 putative kinesin [Leptomonas pyrrhocoris]|eukprot:XP_015657083.1 putative kinesin [Leptomonas pyrrhocoris]
MSVDAGNASQGRVSPGAPPLDALDIRADGDVVEGADSSMPSSSVSKLESSAVLPMTGPSSHTALHGPETATPGVSTACVLGPGRSPRGTQASSLVQESVSVIVRLKGAPTLAQVSAGASENLTSPATLTSSLRSGLLLDYSVEDGTLRSPRTGRRPPSRSGGALTPQPHLDSSPCGDEVWNPPPPQQQGQSAAQRSPLLQMEGYNGAAAVTSPSASSTPAIAVTLPQAFTTASATATPHTQALTDAPRSSPTSAAGASPASDAAKAGFPSNPQPSRGGSSCIGCRGKLLTIRSPSTNDFRQYEFGEVLAPDVTNAAVCERLLPAIMEQLNAGYNVCVLCYGQTGSGKTYTMNALGPAVAQEVFRTRDVHNEVVEMSYIQIYNNKAYNLLDGPRAGKFGAQLSKPLQTAMMSMESSSGTHSTAALAGGAANGAFEPKVLVRSAAEVLTRMKAASRMRVTQAHALNPRSSRSFTLLTLHITRFLDGAPLTTTRVTLADLAGTERIKKSGAAGERQSQAIFINVSLMALRELVESGSTETEVLHYRDALLTTYLAPRMRSWHLFLVVTASLEANSYEETKSSLDFATNARRRKVKKLKSRTADRLSGLSLRLYGNSVLGSSGYGRASADVAELQAVVEALQYRISILEESLKVAQLQRAALTQWCTPLVSPRSNDDLQLRSDDQEDSEEDRTRTSLDQLRQSETQICQLRQECSHYRQLLSEREDELRSVQMLVSPQGVATRPPSAEQELAGSLLSNSLTGSCNHRSSSDANQDDPLPRHHLSSQLDSGITVERPTGQPPQQQTQLFSPASSLSASATSRDALAASVAPTAAPGDDQLAATSTEEESDDAHQQLIRSVLQLSAGALAGAGPNSAWEHLHDVALRAKEQGDDVRERLLVVTSTLGGLRAHNHELNGDLLKANRALVAQDERHKRSQEALERARVRARAAEAAVDQLRLKLFRAYAEQSIGEELTRLYLDAQQPTAEALDTLSGSQLAEHREEMEKFETHQRALQDKITELVNAVEQLTRAGSQKDVSLAALESIITPAQRTLFQTMSSVRSDSADIARQIVAVAGEANGEESAADCFSLLQSRVSELESLLQQERQQHQLTRCEVVEAREDARRSRQEQRQAFFQQQEEERRVRQLTAENFDLQRQRERHQLYLDQIHVHFQEQLLELRRYHVAEMAEQRWLLKETQQQAARAPTPPENWKAGVAGEPAGAEAQDDSDAGGFGQSATRRDTPPVPPHASGNSAAEDVARGWAGPPSPGTSAATDEYHHNSSSSLAVPRPAPSPKANHNGSTVPRDASLGMNGKHSRGGKKGHPRKSKERATGARRGGGAAPARRTSAPAPAINGNLRPSADLNSTQPPKQTSRRSADKT